MATVLRTSPDHDRAMTYLVAALKHHKQAAIARHLGVDAGTVRLWEVRQSVPKIPVSDTRANQLFSQADVVPMIEVAAKLMDSSFTQKEAETTASALKLPKNIMSSDLWTKEQLKVAFHLYCQLPFGKLHSRNPEIIELAKLIGRTPSAVAMKLVNFASLDPAIKGCVT